MSENYYDNSRNLDRKLMAIADGAPAGSLGAALLDSCEDQELNTSLLASAMTTQNSKAVASLTGFMWRGGDCPADAAELVKMAEEIFTLAAVFLAQAELHQSRIEARGQDDWIARDNLIEFPTEE